ncbi:PfkB family carbohydrate kinase [Chthonobacter albigriseus]|uniref:PfkB family carbohydrate kinase n=1 Tax=Chthonobacter albigriseus TaxID=1683161 RepID=UPI0015EF4451|nr:PfkB family carbohydrate kinase [Chthonobacter albigriseus]
MPAARIAVVGSLHYDVMVDAPDRPRKGETLIGRSWWPKCGGKGGNQAVEARLAGASVAMIGAVGDDDFGRALIENLDRVGVDRSAVATLPGVGSGMSVAIFDDTGDYGAVVVSGANRAIPLDGLTAERFAGTHVLLLQNEVPEPVNIAAARAAKEAGARVILNAAPARAPDATLVPLVDILVVNAIEAEMLGGGAVSTLQDAAAAAARLAERFASVIVTAGGEGLAVCSPDAASPVSLAADRVTVASTHGAGDCFVGVLAAHLGAGVGLQDAAIAANRAAGRLVAMAEEDRAGRLAG